MAVTRTLLACTALILVCAVLKAECEPSSQPEPPRKLRRLLQQVQDTGGPFRLAWAAIDPARVGCGDFQELLHDSLVSVSFSPTNGSFPTADAAALLDVENVTAYLASTSYSYPFSARPLAAPEVASNISAIGFCPVSGEGTVVEYLLTFQAIDFLGEQVVDQAGAAQLACLLGKTVPVLLSHDSTGITSPQVHSWIAVVGNSVF